jgi:sarcosine oxidase
VVYDVVVIGLGAMGSAVAAQCARRGWSVLGVERHGPAHSLGASHGKSRLIRQAYFEHSDYVPLLLRAYDLWRELEALTGERLVTLTGILLAGAQTSKVITGSTASAKRHDLHVELLDADGIRRRFPMMRPLDEEIGVFERAGGVVFPERAVHAFLGTAVDAGAELRFGVSVLDWRRSDPQTLRVKLSGGVEVTARRIALTLGPWLSLLSESTGIPLRVQRNVQAWFRPKTPDFSPDRCPAFLLDRAGLPNPLYGVPDLGDGVKAAFHAVGPYTLPDELDRAVTKSDTEPIAQALNTWMPGAAGEFVGASACMYSLTPDEHFAIGAHPNDDRVIVAGGFSGHGFKFASVVGELVADMLAEKAPRLDVEFLSPRRFAT